MSRLMDICGLVDYNKELREHDRQKSIFGSILVDEQSDYFEGFVRTYDEKNTYLVFGTFNEKEGFHMYACNEEMDAPKEVVPYASLIKEYGINSGTLKYAEYKNDQIKIVVQDGEIFRNVEPGEISVLQAKVDTIKKQCNLVVENKQKKLK